MSRLFNRLLLALLLAVLTLAPARADEVADLLGRLEAAGARVLRLPPGDARLDAGRVATGIGADGRVEVYVPEGGRAVRTPLRTPVERLSVAEFRELTSEVRTAIRELYGIEVERVYIAGSSSGIPFRDPNTGELRTFDRKGSMTSDYDGAVVSPELYEKVKRDNPRAVRGGGTGKRTAPDPLPGLRQKFEELSQRWGRHVACMVYASEAEFQKRMQLTGLRVGENVMAEAPPGANAVQVTRAELLGALIEVEQLKRLVAARGEAGARALLQAAEQGNVRAVEDVRAVREASTKAVLAQNPQLGEAERGLLGNELRRVEAPRGFALPRAAARAPPAELAFGGPAFTEAEVREVFDRVREGAAAHLGERATTLAPADRAGAEAGVSRVRDASLEITRNGALSIEYLPETNSVRVSTGLLDRVAGEAGPGQAGQAFRRRALGLLFGHELNHAGGIRGEALADAEAVRALERAGLRLDASDARRVVDMFSRTGGRLSDALYALRGLPTYGTPGGRTARLTRAIEGLPDPLSRFRRVDGTLDWTRMGRDGALRHGAGAAHFGLALFLKELAVVVETGDRARIDEFFDGLLTTDFFVTYGAFVAGARAGDVAYSRFLARHVKPRFVGSVLRTNVVLATGMALPALVHGELDGRAFVIDVAALGLSSTAVRAGLAGIEWVVDLRRLEAAGGLARAAGRLRSLARAGSFVYTAAETAVVLYLGEKLATAANRALDDRAARGAVADRTVELLDAARDADTSPARLAALLASFDEAHLAYRDHLMRDVLAAEATYEARLARAARDAKLIADERAAAAERLERLPALRASMVERHGSVEAYLDHLSAERVAELDRDLEAAMASLERSRTAAIDDVYRGRRRTGDYLPSGGDTGGLLGFFARMRARSEARDLSGNRLQAYDDQLAALARVRAAVANDPAKRALVDELMATTREIARRDRALFLGDDATPTPAPSSAGLEGVLERTTR